MIVVDAEAGEHCAVEQWVDDVVELVSRTISVIEVEVVSWTVWRI